MECPFVTNYCESVVCSNAIVNLTGQSLESFTRTWVTRRNALGIHWNISKMATIGIAGQNNTGYVYLKSNNNRETGRLLPGKFC